MRSSPDRRGAPRCYFSLRSPYSWLALRKLETGGFGLGSTLEYLPYFEPPSDIGTMLHDAGGRILYSPMSREKHFYILGDVKRLLENEGLTPKWPSDRDPDWSIPHLAFLACDTDALRRAFLFAAMESRWLSGETIWSWEWVADTMRTLSTLGEADRTLAAAQGEDTRRMAADILNRAYHDGVFGVPFLVVGREKFWGFDRVDAFVEASRRA